MGKYGREITPKYLREILSYDAETGSLTWRPRGVDHFPAAVARSRVHNMNLFNAKYAGKEAFTSVNAHGYRSGGICGKVLKAHRVAWAIHFGEWPLKQIDHKNGNREDNRLSNLREVDPSGNAKNTKVRDDNTSGHIGVSLFKLSGKWRAYISVSGKRVSLGHFERFDDAVAAREAAEREHGYHANHGRTSV